VVGSAAVRIIENSAPGDATKAMGALVAQLATGLK